MKIMNLSQAQKTHTSESLYQQTLISSIPLCVNFGPIATLSFLTFGGYEGKKHTFSSPHRVRSSCTQLSQCERSGANGKDVTTSNATVRQLPPEKKVF